MSSTPAIPIIQAWRSIFPKLFKDASEMPADLRAHARYPQQYFEAQAEIYRTFHMRDPEAFYNKEDQWDLAKENYGQGSRRRTRPAHVRDRDACPARARPSTFWSPRSRRAARTT